MEQIEYKNDYAEQAFLINIFIQTDILYDTRIEVEHLGNPPFQVIYKTMKECFLENRDITQVPLLIPNEIKNVYEDMVVSKIGEIVLPQDKVEEIIYTNFLKRQVQQACLITPKKIENMELDHVLNHVQSAFIELSTIDTKADTHSIASVGHAVWERLEAIENGHVETGIPTGIKTLDKLIVGFGNKQLITIGAPSQHGKTAFALTCLLNQAKKGYKVGFFSLEMPKEELMFRLGSMNSLNKSVKVSVDKIMKGYASKEELDAMRESVREIANNKIVINDDTNVNINQIIRVASKWKSQYEIDVLYVDYIQLVEGDRSLKQREREVASITKSLKGLAKKLDIPVIGLAQVNRNPQEGGAMPRIHHLRESAAIEHDSDKVLMMWRPKVVKMQDPNYTYQDAELVIDKNRQGKRGKIDLHFNDDLTVFTDKQIQDIPFPEDVRTPYVDNDPF